MALVTMAKTPANEITILGQRITLKTSEQDPEAVREVLALVRDRIGVAEGRLKKNAAPHQVAVLALLDLAEQYIRSKRKTEEFKSKMSEKSTRLIRLLQAELQASEAGKPASSVAGASGISGINGDDVAGEKSRRSSLPRELSLDESLSNE